MDTPQNEEHTMSKLHHPVRAIAATATGLLMVGAIGAGTAQARDGDVRASGRCSAGAEWKLKLAPRDGRIETEFEVDSNRNGQVWSVRMTDNGATVFAGNRTTTAPSGSFTVRQRIANRAGTDRVVATATFNGQTCRGTASL
jgi:hypothetical protein